MTKRRGMTLERQRFLIGLGLLAGVFLVTVLRVWPWTQVAWAETSDWTKHATAQQIAIDLGRYVRDEDLELPVGRLDVERCVVTLATFPVPCDTTEISIGEVAGGFTVTAVRAGHAFTWDSTKSKR